MINWFRLVIYFWFRSLLIRNLSSGFRLGWLRVLMLSCRLSFIRKYFVKRNRIWRFRYFRIVLWKTRWIGGRWGSVK